MCLSSRQKRSATSKAAKRLLESQDFAHTRRAATKKYQTAVRQRSEALKKNALGKADELELDDPHVSQAYDLWNIHDAKKGLQVHFHLSSSPSSFFTLLNRTNTISRWFENGFVHGTNLSNI